MVIVLDISGACYRASVRRNREECTKFVIRHIIAEKLVVRSTTEV